MRVLGVSRVGDPVKPFWQLGRVNVAQDNLDCFRHESLMRELIAREEVREELRLIFRRCKVRGATGYVRGFANEKSQKKVEETFKDLGPKQTGEFGDVKDDFWW